MMQVLFLYQQLTTHPVLSKCCHLFPIILIQNIDFLWPIHRLNFFNTLINLHEVKLGDCWMTVLFQSRIVCVWGGGVNPNSCYVFRWQQWWKPDLRGQKRVQRQRGQPHDPKGNAGKVTFGRSIGGKSDLDFTRVQTKKVERKAVSSSDSEEEKEDKITVAYKSTRSAVSCYFCW